MTAEIVWADPPPDSRGRDWRVITAHLRARPGEWARFPTSAASAATSVKQGRYLGTGPAGSFEAITRGRPDGGLDMYVRYVGEPS